MGSRLKRSCLTMHLNRTIAVVLFAGWAVGCLPLASAAAAEAVQPAAQVSFELDVMPILTARGCNQGACHGKARGQNGFQLSLLAFDPEFDYAALTRQARGRRVFPAAPERSLLLQKATAEVPHGGGVRIAPAGPDYELLRRWIAAGAPRQVAGEPQLVSVAVSPTQRFMKPDESQPLVVTATYSDGSTRDVSSRTAYQSSEAAIVAVDHAGVMQAGPLPGEATIMARYMSQIATCSVAIPLAGSVPDAYYAQLPRQNLIDALVWSKLK
jgi:hypothetical protein